MGNYITSMVGYESRFKIRFGTWIHDTRPKPTSHHHPLILATIEEQRSNTLDPLNQDED